MNFMPPMRTMATGVPLRDRLRKARSALKPPTRLNLVQWADRYRYVSLSSSPGRWKTRTQPVAYGPMMAVTESDTSKITVMAGTQVVKSELLKNVAYFFIHQEPSPILFVQPSQGAAASFSKERFTPDVRKMPELQAVIEAPKSRDSDNTITHKEYAGGPLDFVGANSPTDLASRPKRVVLCDEIDKYPVSAGPEGDPLTLAEERASTYEDLGLAKFVRACSPTEKGKSRIGREYEASDQRRCFLACPHCGHEQVLTWANVKWEKVLEDGTVTVDVPAGQHAREHRPGTASIACEGCGALWTERERIRALDALEHALDHGWRQTRQFFCCDERQTPSQWDEAGRSLCRLCGERSSYDGHAGFVISKLYSARHKLARVVKEFLDAVGDPELMKKFTNTALAELWEPAGIERMDGSDLINRAEPYGPDDLPNEVLVVTGFCDVQGDRLEVQLIGWGADEESWPFLYEVINLDPAQPQAWKDLKELTARTFTRTDGRMIRIAAFGIDYGGHHGSQVLSFCRQQRGQRIFPCVGRSGKKPIWSLTPYKTKTGEKLWPVGVDSAKDAIYARLKIDLPEEGRRKPGFIHFPTAAAFGPEYFAQLTSERRETRKRLGQSVTVWVLPGGKRNEVLDTFVGALAVRQSLPRRIEATLEYSAAPIPEEPRAVATTPKPQPQTQQRPGGFLGRHKGWLR